MEAKKCSGKTCDLSNTCDKYDSEYLSMPYQDCVWDKDGNVLACEAYVNKIGVTKPEKREIARFDSGMIRDTNSNKPRFDLIMPLDVPYELQMLTRWAVHMEKGARHYGERNWEKANGEEELKRFKESAFRHFMQWYCGLEDEDHAVAVMFNITGAERLRGEK